MIYLLAFVAMFVEDVLLTWMVQAQARGLWVLAGTMDTLGFFAQLTCLFIGVDSIQKYGFDARTVGILVALSAANFLGTGLGTKYGDRWIHASNLPRAN